MPELAPSELRVVLYEGAGAFELEAERRAEVLGTLLDAGYQVTRTVTGGRVSADDGRALVALGRFSEEVDLGSDSESGAGGGVHRVDVDDSAPAELLERVRQIGEGHEAEPPGEWTPWFPVIDYDRCTNCMQCLSFCLFDVYSVDDEAKIKVQNQSNCKTNCPACSRVCPEAAIMFPKYKQGPINGAQVSEEDLQRESMKVDISALLGGDIYSALRSRQKEARDRFSTERDESRALIERKRCLTKLQKDLDIPSEVLMSLPSAGDIEERARRAKEKLAKRMERSQTVRDQKSTTAPTEKDWGI